MGRLKLRNTYPLFDITSTGLGPFMVLSFKLDGAAPLVADPSWCNSTNMQNAAIHQNLCNIRTNASILMRSIFRSRYYEIFVCFRTDSLRLEDKDALRYSFNNFPHTTYMSPWVENCRNYTLIFCCSPETSENYERDLSHCFSSFHVFSLQLDTLQCNVDSFLCMRTCGLLFQPLNDKSKESFWFWFQIWHQLIFIFCFWVGTSPYSDFFRCRFQISQLLATMLFFGINPFPQIYRLKIMFFFEPIFFSSSSSKLKF